MSLKMKAAVLDEVVRRLRSGDYAQGASALRRLAEEPGGPDQFCCLGIVCEMAVEEGILSIVRTPNQPGASYGYAASGDSEVYTAYLPPAVVEWAGIVSDVEKESGLGDYYYEERGAFSEAEGPNGTLASMNDSGTPFPEIADWMEANVERV